MQSNRQYRKKKVCAAFVLSAALACAFVPGTAHSLSGIVHDPVQTAKHVAEFKEQVARWKETAAHYKQQLITARGMNFMSTEMQIAFPEVPPDYGIEEECRKKSEGIAGAITSFFKPDVDAEILEQQHLICRRTVEAENMKYNVTVRFLNKLRLRHAELDRLDITRDEVGSMEGKMKEADYDLQRHQHGMQMDIDHWNAMIVAYDEYIQSLEKFQRRLAVRALNGKQPDIFSSVIQGEVLKETLRSMRDSD